MFHPGLGRFLQEDPKGFDAGDPNLFRFGNNNPTNVTDPFGLEAHPPSRVSIWRWDWPDISTKGDVFARAWFFGDEEMRNFKMGCVGLASIRTGSYLTGKLPQHAKGVRCFWKLDDALKVQKVLNEDLKDKKQFLKRAVLFAIESKNDIKEFAKPLDKAKEEIDPTSLDNAKLEPYDFATAFQKSDGTIVYWERMPWGQRQNPDLVVNRTEDHVYNSRVYCVVVSESKFQPHTVGPDDHISRKKR